MLVPGWIPAWSDLSLVCKRNQLEMTGGGGAWRRPEGSTHSKGNSCSATILKKIHCFPTCSEETSQHIAHSVDTRQNGSMSPRWVWIPTPPSIHCCRNCSLSDQVMFSCPSYNFGEHAMQTVASIVVFSEVEMLQPQLEQVVIPVHASISYHFLWLPMLHSGSQGFWGLSQLLGWRWCTLVMRSTMPIVRGLTPYFYWESSYRETNYYPHSY